MDGRKNGRMKRVRDGWMDGRMKGEREGTEGCVGG
jgi:hypothetical protein